MSAALNEREPPRLIILDLMLPGMSGIELCRRLRNLADYEGSNLPLLARVCFCYCSAIGCVRCDAARNAVTTSPLVLSFLLLYRVKHVPDSFSSLVGDFDPLVVLCFPGWRSCSTSVLVTGCVGFLAGSGFVKFVLPAFCSLSVALKSTTSIWPRVCVPWRTVPSIEIAIGLPGWIRIVPPPAVLTGNPSELASSPEGRI